MNSWKKLSVCPRQGARFSTKVEEILGAQKQQKNDASYPHDAAPAPQTSNHDFFTSTTGQFGSLEYRMNFFERYPNGLTRPISPWHHIPSFPQLINPHRHPLDQASDPSATTPSTSTQSSICHSSADFISADHFELRHSQAENQLSAFTASLPTATLSPDGSTPSELLDMFINPQFRVNMIVEIPKFEREKMEISTGLPSNPIVQDVKKGKPRLSSSPLYWNYGAVPQTWESPDVRGNSEVEHAAGDNDPVDIVELGDTPLRLGQIVPVRLLGCLAMIDQNELDWKFIGIREDDPRSQEDIRDIRDVEELFPKHMNGITEWLRWCKLADGKPLNRFGYGEAWLPTPKASEVIIEAHSRWRELLRKPSGGLWVPKLIL